MNEISKIRVPLPLPNYDRTKSFFLFKKKKGKWQSKVGFGYPGQISRTSFVVLENTRILKKKNLFDNLAYQIKNPPFFLLLLLYDMFKI